MEPMTPKRSGRSGPEHKIQSDIMDYMRRRGWLVRHIHGSAYQAGWPDLWCSNRKYGHRWVEVKLPGMKGSKFTPGQLEMFPLLCASGSGVWVLTAAKESEYLKLWKPPNWYLYLNVLK